MAQKTKRTKVCPYCGQTFASSRKTCPKCGRELTSRKKSGRKGKAAKTDKVACPVCLAWIPKDLEQCPVCKADIPVAYEVMIKSIQEEEPGESGEGADEQQSPQSQVEVAEVPCPVCENLGKVGSKCPICGALIEEPETTAEPSAPVEPEVPEKQGPVSAQGISLSGANPDTQTCHVCSSIIPKKIEMCPVCGARLAWGAPLKVREQSETDQLEIKPAEAVAPVAPIVAETERSPRTRKLRTTRGRIAPPAIPEEPPMRTYGIRYLRGPPSTNKGMVNGTGLVNGESFVNGTGISNGVRGRSSSKAARRPSIVVRWQLLAVLAVLLIVLPLFVFLSYHDEGAISIDGHYNDWKGVTTYGTRIPSTEPSSNITEWAVATQGTDLFLYFRTEISMMGASNPESYYLFVDSDGLGSTGYVVESLGADYLLQLTGWSSTVRSTSLMKYTSASDQYNWTGWRSIDSLSCSCDSRQLEASAHMPAAVSASAKFVLVSKDASNRGSTSFTAPMKGGLLVIRQMPSAGVASSGIVPRGTAVALLNLKITCEGEDGEVSQISPSFSEATLTSPMPGFKIQEGGQKEITVTVDTSDLADGQFVSAGVLVSGVVSTFANVQIIGCAVGAYVVAPPPSIAIDGAFADWNVQLSQDYDSIAVNDPGVDIDKVGNLSTSLNSYFYVSVRGEVCSGTFVPASVSKPSAGGGGVVVPARRTAEDVLSVYVDSDKSTSTGEVVTVYSKSIGADQKIEVKGLFGMITSTKHFDYVPSTRKWVESAERVDAAKDEHRIEIGVAATSLDGSADIDFIVETTTWKGQADLATYMSATMVASMKTWVVDPILINSYATSMSYQRKMFFDGANHWSLYFDGANTVCKYSADNGQTWNYCGRVFTTPGVNETSIWYDSSSSTVYAVGDTSLPSRSVSVQIGVVDAAAHRIVWASEDANLTASLNPIAGKNTYISKDSNGFLWVLSTNWTQVKPLQHGLSAFRSTAVNSTSSWIDTGDVLPYGMYENNSKGSIVPAGSGSDMWAIYTYSGYVAAKKYQDGAWPADYDEVIIYKADTSWANTDNSPPSVVVDGKGVVHVVYGTGRMTAVKPKVSIPQIFYSHNNTNSITFTAGLNLDPSNDTLVVANYYPTISLDSSTGDLYVFWLQSDTSLVPKTVMCRKCVSGVWSDIAIEPQTTFTKQFLTSVYSVSGEFKICWQWTQNASGTVQVLYDSFWVPENRGIAPLVAISIAIMALFTSSARRGRRGRR